MDSFDERIKNFGIFAAIYKNLSRFKSIDKEKSISIGFIILIYIYNEMVQGKDGADYESIKNFISIYDNNFDSEDVSKIVRTLMYEDGFSGIKFEYYDYRQNTVKEIRYKLLSVKTLNEPSKTYYVYLTDSGKEFMMKTLEVYKELRITMELLFLQEQFKNGAFDIAKNSLNNIKVIINDKLNEIDKLISEIKRALWRIDIENIKKVYDFMISQSEHEKELFDKIFSLIYNIGENIHLKEEKKKQIEDIKDDLNVSREMHSKLLSKYEKIYKTIIESGDNVFYNIINKNINVETEFLDSLLQADEIEPTITDIFNGLSIDKNINFYYFFKNNYYKESSKSKIITDIDFQEVEEDVSEFIELLESIFTLLKDKEEICFSDLDIDFSKKQLNYVIYLHQKKHIVINKTDEMIKEVFDTFGYDMKDFFVKSSEKVFYVNDYKITDFLIYRGA